METHLNAILARPGARIADVGCGAGWSTVALAQAYPDATLVGFDIDAPSIAMAEANAASPGFPTGSASRWPGRRR
jgi:trans-aconitate methyltransferase